MTVALLLVTSCASAPSSTPLPEAQARYRLERDAAVGVGASEVRPRARAQEYRSPSGRPPRPAPQGPLQWQEGQALLQGFVGVADAQKVERTDDPESVEGGSDFDAIPVIGGGGQWKLGGDRVDMGLEGMLTLGGRANGGAIYVGSGGGAVAVSLDLFTLDVYGGPFASIFLGEKLRLYGSLGPVMQWASYHQSGVDRGSGSGFGYGWYTRAGLEFRLDRDTQIGVGARWADTKASLSDSRGDLDIEGTTFFVSLSRGI